MKYKQPKALLAQSYPKVNASTSYIYRVRSAAYNPAIFIYYTNTVVRNEITSARVVSLASIDFNQASRVDGAAALSMAIDVLVCGSTIGLSGNGGDGIGKGGDSIWGSGDSIGGNGDDNGESSDGGGVGGGTELARVGCSSSSSSSLASSPKDSSSYVGNNWSSQKQGDYDMWKLRIEQYFQVQDYALWDVIENGNSFKPVPRITTNTDGTRTSTIPGPVTTEEKAQKKNDVKARSITNEVDTASTPVSTVSSHDNTANLSNATVHAFLENQPNGSQMVHGDLEQIHEDDLEEIDLKWQLALLNVLGTKKDTSSKAMVAIDGAGFDWNYMANDEVPTNMAFMAFSDSEEFQHPEFKGHGPKDSKNVCIDISNEIKKSLDALIIEDWVSDSDADESKVMGAPQDALKDQGYFDNGYSRHMTGNISYLTNFKEHDEGYVTFGGGAKGGNITGKGTIRTGKLDFEDVYFVNELQFKLFSVSQMCDKKNSVLFTDTECFVLSPNFKLANESQVLLKVPRKNNMYSFDIKNIVPQKDLTRPGGARGGNITSKGTIRTDKLDFEDVYFFKELQFNLFSFSQTCGKKNSVLFTDTEYFVLSPNFKLADESHVLFKVPSKNNTYNFNMKNIVPQKDLTYLLAKATNDESILWVLVVKPYFKTPYELFKGRSHALSFMRPFGCHVSILNTLDQLGKFDENQMKGSLLATIQLVKLLKCTNSNDFACKGASFDAASKSDNQERPNGESSTKTVNTAGLVNTATPTYVNYPNDPLMPDLEDVGIFDDSYDDRDEGVEADYNNLKTIILVSPIPSTKNYKDHPKEHIIREVNSTLQTRKIAKQNEARLISFINKQRRINHKDFQNCLFACFLSQMEPKKVKKVNDEVRIQALVDGKRVNIKESSIRRIMRLDDAEVPKPHHGMSSAALRHLPSLSCYQSKIQFIKLGDMTHHKDIFDTPLLTKKVFANMKRVAGHNLPLPSPSHDPLPSGEDSLKLKELMDLCTNSSNKVLDLESEVIDIKSTYKARIVKLESRAKRLEEENRVLKGLKGVHSTVDSDEHVIEKEESLKAPFQPF
nr:ribonuclease H-like domain-containing protein [Tanacetum cinerariifolium]